jgi:Zn-dependent protease with chaperone function
MLLRRVRRATRALSRGFSALRRRIGHGTGGPTLQGPHGLVGMLAILGALVVVGVLLLLVLCVLWLPLWLVTAASRMLSAALSRASEFAADRHATELGYGDGLTRVLALLELEEQRRPRRGRLTGRFASHPSCRSRIQAVQRLRG